jgi:hypothetical protein
MDKKSRKSTWHWRWRMSKERELLKETLSFLVLDWGRGEKLYKQIEAILAQSETEQEGVYQKLLRLEDGVGTEILPSELWLDGYETGKRTLPTNQQPVVPTPKPVPPPNEFIKEHTIPRQQLKEIKVPCGSTEYMFGFKDGVLYAEKEHGIGVNNEKI